MGYRSRKFILAAGVILAATSLLAFGQLTGAEWVQSTGAALLFYNAANVSQKALVKP
jgi:hypothetical protein